MNSRLRVLHVFKEYLQPTENWAFNLISNIPDVETVIGSRKFLRTNFYRPDHTCIEFPVRPLQASVWGLRERALARLARELLRLYPWYLRRQAGSVDVVHSHFGFVGWAYQPMVSRMKAPHVVSFYGYDYISLPWRDPAWHGRYEQLFRKADRFVCEGRAAAQLLERMGCPGAKIRVVPLGVEPSCIGLRARRKEQDRLDLVQMASFREKKGHIHTVRAFKEALTDCPNMTLTLAGPDSDGIRDGILREAGPDRCKGRIRVIDGVDYEDMRAFLEQFQVFIHPSCHAKSNDCEGGAPVVLIDAQASGMPVISTRHCDIPDVVADNKSGLLADEADVTALADHIRRFYRMGQAEYDTFARAAVAHIADHYDITTNARLLREVYAEVVAERCSAGRS